jgi:hypothetical protein
MTDRLGGARLHYRAQDAVRERLHLRNPDRLGVVYFIVDQRNRAVKIGWTGRTPETRRAALQIGSSVPLIIAGSIPARESYEQWGLHNEVGESHVRGEWFRLNGHVVAVAWEHGVDLMPYVPRSQRQRMADAVVSYLPGFDDADRWLRHQGAAQPVQLSLYEATTP